MSDAHPIHQRLQDLGAETMPYGPAEQDIHIAATLGEYEAEYAAIRRHVAILHLPQRGLLDLRGLDAKDMLHRLATQDVNAMKGGDSRRSFQLNTQGRIVADIVIHHGDQNTWLESDVFDLPALTEQIESRVFTEDVSMQNISEAYVCLALIGPAALTLLDRLAQESAENVAAMAGTHHVLTLAGVKCTAYRVDDCGVPGVRLFLPREQALGIYDKLLDAAGYEPDAEPDADFAQRRRAGLRGRPIGWLAYNTARIEAGSPIFHIDFGPDSLPAETGLLETCVSFTKGCYLGQEVVARMQNLGHPKRVLTGFRMSDEPVPLAGAEILPHQDAENPANPVGGVTSSAQSPMCGSCAIGFAVMKWGHHQPGTRVRIPAEGQLHPAEIQGLHFMQMGS